MKNFILLFIFFIPFLLHAQSLETFAGTGAVGMVNGPIDQATFGSVEQMAIDSEGNIFICDYDNHSIRKIDVSGEISTYAGTGVVGDVLGDRLSAQFNFPVGIAIDINDNIYVVDGNNNKVKVIRPSGEVELVAGTGMATFADGSAEIASFDFPVHICVDSEQNLFVADNNNNRIRKIDIGAGMVSTFAGNDLQGHKDGIGDEAIFFLPQGIAIDQDDNLFIGDRNNNAIRKITPERVVTTYAGTTDEGFADGPAETALFSGPKGLTVDSIGNVYVADRLNFVIRKIDTSGMVSSIAGIPETTGYLDGPIDDGTLIGRAVDVICYQDGLLISDWGNNVIRYYNSTPITSNKRTEFGNNESITISPNPSSDVININGDLGINFEIKIFNVQGKIIKATNNVTSIEVASIPSGMYFIQVKGAEYLNVQQVVIK